MNSLYAIAESDKSCSWLASQRSALMSGSARLFLLMALVSATGCAHRATVLRVSDARELVVAAPSGKEGGNEQPEIEVRDGGSIVQGTASAGRAADHRESESVVLAPSVRLDIGASLYTEESGADPAFGLELAGGPAIRLGGRELFLVPEVGVSLDIIPNPFGDGVLVPMLAVPLGVRLVSPLLRILSLELGVHGRYEIMNNGWGVDVGGAARFWSVIGFGVYYTYLAWEPQAGHSSSEHLVRVALSFDLFGVFHRR